MAGGKEAKEEMKAWPRFLKYFRKSVQKRKQNTKYSKTGMTRWKSLKWVRKTGVQASRQQR